jgi:hypothetical protein
MYSLKCIPTKPTNFMTESTSYELPCAFNLASCSLICLLQLRYRQFSSGGGAARLGSYYRLGKNRPGSGILSRYSWSAENFQTIATTMTIPAPAMAVLAFQFAGWQYQPPAGDQTCFGYLGSQQLGPERHSQPQTHGIFPPPPIVKCVVSGVEIWELV